MSNYIVLVKQVPDVARITDNAFDPATGNLIRSKLASVINELDAQALAFAWRMKEISADQSARIICLSMGPPMAAEVLRYGLSRGAEAGVLLTDRALGGADTPATANPLAHAVKKIKQDLLGGTDDFYIICGMQSVDGDTAQVPPQIAEELGIACLPYATEVEFVGGRFRFQHIISGGAQVVELERTPAVITVAKYEYPLYPSFAATRQAMSSKFIADHKIHEASGHGVPQVAASGTATRASVREPARSPQDVVPRDRLLIQWGADDVKPTAMGGSGSKTRVIRVFPPPKTCRLGLHLSSVEELADVLRQTITGQVASKAGDENAPARYLLPTRRASWFDRSFEGTDKECADFAKLAEALTGLGITGPEQLAAEDQRTAVLEQLAGLADFPLSPKVAVDLLAGLAQRETAYQGEVWVMAEHEGGALNAATFELIGKARELADSLEVRVGVVLAGHGVAELAPSLIAAGADQIYLIEHPLLAEFDPLSYRKAVAELFTARQPQILLFGATPQGRVLAPMVAYRAGCGLTADCTELTIRDISRKGQLAVMMQTRPALGGNIMATISSRNSSCQMATARPGVMRRLPPDPDRRGEVVNFPVELSAADLSLKIIENLGSGGQKVDFACDVIVGGGKGLNSRDNFAQLLDDLQAALSAGFEVKVGKGASRAAVEQGFVERAFQVGQTGTAVGPKVYLAIGISGAIQHMIGVAGSGTIIAVNADPQAPIFKQSDYYLVGRAEQVIPELIRLLKDQS